MKVKSKQFLKWKLRVQFIANCMSVVVLQYTVVFNVKTASSVNLEIKSANYKSFLAFFNLVRAISSLSRN